MSKGTYHDSIPQTWYDPTVIGDGPFGKVYLFHSKDTTVAPLAAKVFDPALNLGCKYQSYYEENLLRQLKHINIIQWILGPQELNGFFPNCSLMCMEYCNHGNLRQLIEKSENVFGAPQHIIMDLLFDIGNGIDYLHSKQIIHRNIKPENILLHQQSPNNIIYKLGDFGYARQFSVTSNFKSFVGTFQYISPEVIKSMNLMKEPDHLVLPNSTVDLWALGVSTFELMTGSRPFMIESVGMDWTRQIECKGMEDIHIFIDESGRTVFSKLIPRPHNLSPIFTKYLTKWLQLLLDSNPQTRGGRDPRLLQKNVWFNELQFIQGIRVINFALLHEWSMPEPCEFTHDGDRDGIVKLFKDKIGNPTDFLLLSEDGKSLDNFEISECYRNRNEGYIYVVPIPSKYEFKYPEFNVPIEIHKILRGGFISTNKQKVILQVKKVFSFLLDKLCEYELFFRGGVALSNHLRHSIQKLRDLNKELACLRSSMKAIDIAIPESTIDSTVIKLQQLSNNTYVRKTKDSINSVIHTWTNLKQAYITTVPEINAIGELCSTNEKLIQKIESLVQVYPCQVYLSEVQTKIIGIKSLFSILLEMIEKVGYTNGVKISKCFHEELDFIRSRPLKLQAFYSTVSSGKIISTTISNEKELERASILMRGEFISGVSQVSNQAIDELISLSAQTLNRSTEMDKDRTI